MSIFLLSAYLISATELNQLMKIPQFIEHFIVHKGKDSQMSLSEFIEMHYVQSDDKDADHDEDMKLPFKTHNICANGIGISFVPDSFIDLSFKPTSSEEKSYSNYKVKFLTSSYLSSIWQPPKSC